ncbi:hypothetical protein QBC40DRAFT_23511 [Triangularia verruculosa]|uniref:Uncharacterized protein n=1 Tax=Triangularia verruculosa TaxID=2587418 RepID=A0AAN7AQV7_9PEZI|nr:hypothetical protein QBC40DRAFT_23511 [Triangularia verruculosa]
MERHPTDDEIKDSLSRMTRGFWRKAQRKKMEWWRRLSETNINHDINRSGPGDTTQEILKRAPFILLHGALNTRDLGLLPGSPVQPGLYYRSSGFFQYRKGDCTLGPGAWADEELDSLALALKGQGPVSDERVQVELPEFVNMRDLELAPAG